MQETQQDDRDINFYFTSYLLEPPTLFVGNGILFSVSVSVFFLYVSLHKITFVFYCLYTILMTLHFLCSKHKLMDSLVTRMPTKEGTKNCHPGRDVILKTIL